jgi:hypothetical protein
MTYHITADDYADAQRAHNSSKASSRWRRRISLTIILVFFALSVTMSIFDSQWAVMMRPAIIVLLVWFCLLFVLWYTNFLWRWQYSKIDALKREFIAEVDEEGITSSTEVARSEMKWTVFIRWYEGKKAFLLYTQPRLFHIYPKRAFGPGEVDEFRALLQRRIPAK